MRHVLQVLHTCFYNHPHNKVVDSNHSILNAIIVISIYLCYHNYAPKR